MWKNESVKQVKSEGSRDGMKERINREGREGRILLKVRKVGVKEIKKPGGKDGIDLIGKNGQK